MIDRDIILLAGPNAAAVAPRLLEESRFAVRVLTRDVEQAARLRELGAEVITLEASASTPHSSTAILRRRSSR